MIVKTFANYYNLSGHIQGRKFQKDTAHLHEWRFFCFFERSSNFFLNGQCWITCPTRPITGRVLRSLSYISYIFLSRRQNAKRGFIMILERKLHWMYHGMLPSGINFCLYFCSVWKIYDPREIDPAKKNSLQICLSLY